MNLVIVALFVALLWGISPVIHKSVLTKVSPRMLLIFNGIMAAVFVTLYGLLNRNNVLQEIHELDKTSLGWMTLAVFLSWFLAPIIFYTTLQKGVGHIVIALAYSSPLFSLILAWLFLNEKISLTSFIGVMLIVLGIIFIGYAQAQAGEV